jgi:hypothetical protein
VDGYPDEELTTGTGRGVALVVSFSKSAGGGVHSRTAPLRPTPNTSTPTQHKQIESKLSLSNSNLSYLGLVLEVDDFVMVRTLPLL